MWWVGNERKKEVKRQTANEGREKRRSRGKFVREKKKEPEKKREKKRKEEIVH